MLSRARRRSGIAFCKIMELLHWTPDVIFQLGVGIYYAQVIQFVRDWPNVKLIGCEPNVQIVESIKEKYPGEIIECAISNFEGTATLYNKHRHKDGSSLYSHHNHHDNETYTETKVEVTTLDKLFPDPRKYGKNIILWADCEGSEYPAFQGAENFIKYVSVVNVEMTAKPMGEGWSDVLDVHNWLCNKGFKRQWIHTQRSEQGQYDVIYVRDEVFRPEYCCCPFTVMGN